MLVLTRKSGEGIWIGDNIRVVVVEVHEGQVKLGIQASKETPIYRDEIYEKVKGENVASSHLGKDEFEWLRRSLKKP